jgi:hypothetical protein
MLPWLTSPNVTGNRGIAIRKNTSTTLSSVYQGGSIDSTQQACSWGGYLVPGDTISLFAFSSVADSVRVSTGNGAAFLSVARIG